MAPTAFIRPFISAPATSGRGELIPTPLGRSGLGAWDPYTERRLVSRVGAETGDAGRGTLGAEDGARTSVARTRLGAETEAKTGFVGDGGVSRAEAAASCRPNVEGTLGCPEGTLTLPVSSSQPSPPEAILGRCLPSRRLSVVLRDPYLSFEAPEAPAVGASPDDTGGRPKDSPEDPYLDLVAGSGELEEGLSKTFRADKRDETGLVGAAVGRVGVASSCEGGWKRFPKGDDLTGVAFGDITTGEALMVGISSADSAPLVSVPLMEAGLALPNGIPDAAALASLRFRAFAFALAILSSVA